MNKYERIISLYFAEININVFEKLSVVWKVGEQCSYLDLSQISKLRSKSKEFTPKVLTGAQPPPSGKKIIESKSI